MTDLYVSYSAVRYQDGTGSDEKFISHSILRNLREPKTVSEMKEMEERISSAFSFPHPTISILYIKELEDER